LLSMVPYTTPITITPGTPFNSGDIAYPPNYNSAPWTTIRRKIFVVVGTTTGGVANDYYISTVIDPCPAGGITPIYLSNFYAQRKGANALLTWKTETEVNAKGFDIERKIGNDFVKVGYVKASNSLSGDNYSFQEANTSKGISLYRLKLIDNDGSYKLSENRSIKGTAAVSDFTVYPNPSNGSTKISITDITEATTVEIVDNAGRIVRTEELKTGNTIQVNNLQTGLYLVRVINKVTGDFITKKLTVNN